MKLCAGHGAYHTVDESALLVEEKRRGAVHAVLSGNLLVMVHVQYCEFHTPCVLGSQLLQNRRQSLAMASPWGKELEEHGPGEAQNFFAEGRVGYVNRFVGEKARQGQMPLAASADRTVVAPSVARYAVLGPAVGAADNHVLGHTTNILAQKRGVNLGRFRSDAA